jgi:hypothetical protein
MGASSVLDITSKPGAIRRRASSSCGEQHSEPLEVRHQPIAVNDRPDGV